MEEEIVLKPNLEFHLFRTYKAYEEFRKRKKGKRTCMMMKLGPLTCSLREMAGVERDDYPIVVAMIRERKKREKKTDG